MSNEHNPMMPNETPPAASLFGAEWDQKERTYRERAKEALESNKQILFKLLASRGITTVIVNFDGYGDSGQIEDIVAQIGSATVELPGEQIEILDPIWDSGEVSQKTCVPRDAIEAMSYDFLEQTHSGWENNDGAYGDFTFDVAEGTITLDYNERYTSSENYTHEF